MLDKLLIGDARQLSVLIGHEKPLVDTIITSPPYGNLIDYSVKGQLGYGQEWDVYLKELMDVLKACHSITKDTGSLWLVADAWREDGTYRLLPLEIANRATAIGWILRDIIIWDKHHSLPYYGRGQFQSVYEYILFFSKTKGFKFYRDRLREVDSLSIWWLDFPERFNPLGKSPTNIWRFPIRPQGGGWRGRREKWRHECPFPTELIARIIDLTTDKGDVVFDPFAGSGVVLATTAAMERHYLGLELNPKFVRQFESIVKTEVLKEYNALLRKRRLMEGLNGSFSSLILQLRALKYARKVTAALTSTVKQLNASQKATCDLEACFCLADLPASLEHGDTLKVRLYFLFSGETPIIKAALKRVEALCAKFPLSQYRIESSIKGYRRLAALKKNIPSGAELYLYPRALIRSFERVQSRDDWFNSDLAQLRRGEVVPVFSNLGVDAKWMLDTYGKGILPQ